MKTKALFYKPLKAVALNCISIFFCDSDTKASRWQLCPLPTDNEYTPLKNCSLMNQSEKFPPFPEPAGFRECVC